MSDLTESIAATFLIDRAAAEKALDDAVAEVEAYQPDEDDNEHSLALAAVIAVLRTFTPIEAESFARIEAAARRDERTKVSEDIARAIDDAYDALDSFDEHLGGLAEAAAIARQYAAQPAEAAVGASSAARSEIPRTPAQTTEELP